MVHIGETKCPKCGNELTYYDTVRRVLLSKYRVSRKLYIRRLHCVGCGSYHRELPPYIFLHKWYDGEIIQGVLDGIITSDTLGFEDYPCEETMKTWKSQKIQGLL